MLTTETLLDDVCSEDPDRVAAALQAAHGRAEELVPAILARLESILADPQAATCEGALFPGFLLHLAAEFRAQAAHPLIARLLRLGEETVEGLLGDITTDDAGPILADTYDGDPKPLIDLLEDTASGPYERGAGLSALAILVRRGRFPREELLDLVVKLAATLDPELEPDQTVANQLVENAVRLHAHEIRGTIMGLYDRNLADEWFIESDYTGAALEPDAPPARESKELDATIENAWDALKDWSFFTEERFQEDDSSDLETDVPPPKSGTREPLRIISSPSGPYRAAAKVARNDPCPCGSGKKFKKCCGR